MLKLAILGSGNGSNCQAIIDAIEKGTLKAEITCIISDHKEAHILQRARNHQIPALYIDGAPFRTKIDGEAEERLLEILAEHEVNFIALAGFMRILKSKLVRAYEGRMLNIHPSLLPSFPGCNSAQQALDYGVKVTGCTVHYVDDGIDTGKIVHQRAFRIESNDTIDSVLEKMHRNEHIAYIDSLCEVADKLQNESD